LAKINYLRGKEQRWARTNPTTGCVPATLQTGHFTAGAAVAQLVEALRYKQAGRELDFFSVI
jgi:hypothetical protein